MAFYELMVLGSATPMQYTALEARVAILAGEFEQIVPGDFLIRPAADARSRDRKAAIVALNFGGDPASDAGLIASCRSRRPRRCPCDRQGCLCRRGV